MVDERHQNGVEDLGDDQHHDGNLDRGAHILAGVVAGRQHLDGYQAQQARPIASQRHGNLPHIGVCQLAVVEQGGHQGFGKSEQRHGTGHGQQHHDAQTPVQHGRVFLRVPRRFGGSELGGEHHAQSHTQQGRGEFHQPIGIKQPGDAAGRQVRSNLRVDHQGHLRHPHAQQNGRHQRQHPAHARLSPGRAQGTPGHANAGHESHAKQHRDLNPQLQHAPQHHPTRHGVNGLDAARLQLGRPQPGRADHAEIEQHGRCRRHGKVLPGVENAGGQRHHGHEADVGKHPPRHQHGSVKSLGGLAHAAGQGPHQRWRPQHTQRASQQQRPGQGGGHRSDQPVRGLLAFFGFGGCQHGHKGLRKCTLGKQAAKQVGNAESDVEGVREGAGAKHGRHQKVAHQARHAGGQGQQGYGGGGFEQRHRRECIRSAPPRLGGCGVVSRPYLKHPGGCSAAQGPYAR